MPEEQTLPRPVPVTWNDAKLIAAAGGNPESIKALLLAERQPVPTDLAIYQWVSRSAIANKWRPRLVYALLRAGKVTLADVFALADTK